MKKSKNKITIILFAILAVILIVGIRIALNNSGRGKIVSVSSKKELAKIYDKSYGYNDSDMPDVIKYILEFTVLPYSIFSYDGIGYNNYYYESSNINSSSDVSIPSAGSVSSSAVPSKSFDLDYIEKKSKTHSNTNLQVENVDEADITKTDGKYIYSISNNNVLITDVSNPENMEVVGVIGGSNKEIPVDLILNTDKHCLAVIKESGSSNDNTYVTIYNISNIKDIKTEKTFELKSKYYTSRAVNGYIYIISTGSLRKKNNNNNDKEIDISYTEDNEYREIDLRNIQYLKDEESAYQTLVASYKLGSSESINVNSYLFSTENVYVSENNIYIADSIYDDSDGDTIGKAFQHLFGPGGVFGWIHYETKGYSEYKYNTKTNTTIINKIAINEKGKINYIDSAEVSGKTINQFSMDEYNNEFRIALYESNKGSRIVVFDENLKQIGETEYVEPTENMYASRFIGDRAYLVTYRNMDPLFVFDLSNGENPKLLGKLEIPGYSTYLQAYDEDHLIGIGMNSETTVNKDSMGRVVSTSTVITGMKMAIFDVTDVKNPKQISQTIIGDRRTTSAVLDNHKALLFSKEKGIICIPVNTYDNEMKVTDSTNISTIINEYNRNNASNSIMSEGYLVYNINLDEGFKLKGSITHELSSSNSNSTYLKSDLLRGLWIEDYLFTISQSEIKANRISDLKLFDALNLRTYKHIAVQNNENKEEKNDSSNTVSNDVTNSVNNTVVVTNEIEG